MLRSEEEAIRTSFSSEWRDGSMVVDVWAAATLDADGGPASRQRAFDDDDDDDDEVDGMDDLRPSDDDVSTDGETTVTGGAAAS